MVATMTRTEIEALREEADFEAKAAQGARGESELPRSFWASYAAMANTDGGRIVLGVAEQADGRLEVVGLRNPRRVRKALWDGLNNRQVVSASLLRDADVVETDCESRVVVVVTVPRAPRALRPVHLGSNPLTGTFRRGFEGDYRCSQPAVRRMLAEALEDSRDAQLLPGFGLGDLDRDSLAAYRNVFRSTRPGHPWITIEDTELLRNLGGWAHDRDTGKEGLTLAGLLMFGRQPTILEAVHTYLVDYQEQPLDDPEQRWLDRITTDGTWSGNLFDFFRRVYERLVRDLKVPFRMEHGHHRRDETHVHEALREALVNTLIHADYAGSVGILVVRRPDGFSFRNPGTLRVAAEVALAGGTSDCRNRNLQKMFQLIGEGEQAGSGLPKILRAWQEQSWRRPRLWEETELECSKLWLPMSSLVPPEAVARLQAQLGARFDALDALDRLALVTALVEGKVSNQRLREVSAEHPADLTARLRDLVGRGLLLPSGRTRGTFYTLGGTDESEPPLEVLFRGGKTAPSSEHPGAGSLQSPGSSEHLAPSSEHSAPSSEHSAPSSEHLPLSRAAASEAWKQLEALAGPVRATRKAPHADVEATILRVCAGRFVSLRTLAALLGRTSDTLRVHYLTALIREGRLDLRYPDRPSHPAQEYRTREPEHA
ncbi:MAG: putative DNA binding domain-containing protein [Thermoanaerobaculaceae bacterium]|nr:putative DNA binding domain-containing protein [Thermoanaerobaculaceae bacterium]NLH11617.1 hypothetical protein [Holophagae bacterium]